jgi:hydrogenase nickel incorporation protein HypA/HybF
MHELGLAAQIHAMCRQRLVPGARLQRVQLAVGELSAVEPELLRYAWQAVVGGGADAGATLDITWCVATQRCTGCGAVAERDDAEWKRECPRCGGTLAIEGGFELDVRGLDYTEERGTAG